MLPARSIAAATIASIIPQERIPNRISSTSALDPGVPGISIVLPTGRWQALVAGAGEFGP
jgi:hypothetical protein